MSISNYCQQKTSLLTRLSVRFKMGTDALASIGVGLVRIDHCKPESTALLEDANTVQRTCLFNNCAKPIGRLCE